MDLKNQIKETLFPIANARRWIDSTEAFRQFERPNSGIKVCFHTIRSLPSNPLIYFETILAHALNFRGGHSQMLFCGDYFNECDADHHFNSHESYCKRCRVLRKPFIESLNIDSAFYRNFVTEEERKEIEAEVDALDFSQYESHMFHDIDVGYISKMTLFRYYQNWLLPNTPEMKQRFRNTVVRSMLQVKIAENYIQQEKPELMLTLHGVYAAWEPFYKVFVKKGITSYVYAVGMGRLGTMCFLRNASITGCYAMALWETLKNRDLTPAEKADYEEFLNDKFLKNKGWINLLTQGLETSNSETQKFSDFITKHKPSGRIYGIFTNVPWDNSLIQGDGIFKDCFEWFDSTVDFFIKNSDYKLIIKVHPAERLDPHSYTFTKYVSEKYGALPDNIILLSSGTPVTAYEMFSQIDAGLVYTGTLGLEMAMLGHPVLVAGQSHYTAVPGVVTLPENQKRYFELLKDTDTLKVFAKQNKDNAYKYGFAVFRKMEIPLGFFHTDKAFADFDFNSLKNVEHYVKADKNMAHICEKLLAKSDLWRQDDSL